MAAGTRRVRTPGPVAQTGPGTATLVLILAALTALGPLSMDMYLPALPALSRDLNATASLTQLTLTACLTGLALGQATAGPLSDLHGRRRPLLVSSVGYVLTSALCAAAPSASLLILARLAQGTAGGAAIVIARAVVRDRYQDAAAARLFSTLMQISGLAPVLAPLAGGLLLKVTSWRGLFAAITLLGAVLVVAVYRGLPETLPRVRRQRRGPGVTFRAFATLATDRTFAANALAGGLAFAAMFAYISGAPFIIEDAYRQPPLIFSLIFAVNGIGIILAGQVSAARAPRYGPSRMLTAGLVTSLLGASTALTAVAAGLGLQGLLPGLFLVVAAIGLILPNSAALALSAHPPHTAGTASALLGLAQFAIGGIAAPLSGIAGPRTALPMTLVITVLALAALATSLLARPATGSPRSG
jgi:MFS transporter, DHA1 family, multidrug resistance protein